MRPEAKPVSVLDNCGRFSEKTVADRSCCSLSHLDVGLLHNLGPLLGFLFEKTSEFLGRATLGAGAQACQLVDDFLLCKGDANGGAQLVDDIYRRPLWGKDTIKGDPL